MPAFERYLQEETSASIEGGTVRHFGDLASEYAAATHGGVKCPLLSQGIVCFAGADAQSFINAQFTTNCLELTRTQAQLSAWCNPKGRVLFLFTLFTDGERYFALLPTIQIPRFIQRLRMYVLRAAVKIDDLTPGFRQFGLVGEPDTAPPWTVTDGDEGAIRIRLGPGTSRTRLVVPTDAAVDAWQSIALDGAGEIVWQAINILAGMPDLDESASGEFLPQQLNLDRLNAVSFAKGCYPGQEIIARLKYRGEVKKRLAAATCASAGTIAGGTTIRNIADGNTVGRVLQAASIAADMTLLSAVVDVNADWSALVLDDNGDERLRQLGLPYADD